MNKTPEQRISLLTPQPCSPKPKRFTIPVRAYLLLAVVLLISILSEPIAMAQEVPELQINSQRYIVMDAKTGEVYAQRDASDEVAIASLTKVFTAVQALNMASLDTQIITKPSDFQSADATTMGFGPGETYTLRDLIFGMMLPSGNDASYAIARGLGYQEGDTDEEAVQRFMELMNQRIQNMGLVHTHLINPDGWGVPGHHSTAADVAVFMQYAMEYPFLIEVMGTRSYTTSNELITVTTSNKLMNSYSSFIAGKTGYDDDAGWCLAILAGYGDSRMIAVTLDGVAPDDWYDDNRVLLEYGFQRSSVIAGSGQTFNGDVIRYIDPDIVQMANSGQTDAEIADSSSVVPDYQPPTSSDDIVSTGHPGSDMHLEAAGAWLASLSAIAIVGIGGVLKWRHLGGKIPGRAPVSS